MKALFERCWAWRKIVAGIGVGLLLGTAFGATAQTIIDPKKPDLSEELPEKTSGLLSAIWEEKAALDEREERLDLREQTIAAQEASLNEQVAQIEGRLKEVVELQREIEQECPAAFAEQSPEEDILSEEQALALEREQEARLNELAAKIKAMKPNSAALVLTEMDSTLAVQVLKSLDARTSGAIMNNLAPPVAARMGANMVRK